MSYRSMFQGYFNKFDEIKKRVEKKIKKVTKTKGLNSLTCKTLGLIKEKKLSFFLVKVAIF